MAKPYKLPVLPTDEESGPPRPAWQWVALGTFAVLVVWLPLAAIFQTLAARLVAHQIGALASPEEATAAIARLAPAGRVRVALALGGLQAAALAIAALLGGMLIGRWGGQAGVRHAALAGSCATGIALAVAVVRTGPSWAALVALVIGTLAAALGGHVARSRRPSA
jgi:hypothetical protein